MTYFADLTYLFLLFCTVSKPMFTATLLFVKSNTTVYLYVCVCVCVCVSESYQHREKHSVFDGTPRSSLIFPIDFLLLSFLHSQGMGCLNWSRPVKESVSDRQTDRR